MINNSHKLLDVFPNGWEVKKLEEVAKFENGKAHERNIHEDGEYIVVNSKFISSDGKEYKRSNKNLSPLEKGDIAMVMSDVPKGKALAKCFLVNENNKFTLNQRICSIKAVGVNNEYLYFYLNRNKYYLTFDNGVGQTNLRKNEVLECPVLLPPIKEQCKIVTILSSVNKAIGKAEAIIEQTEKVKNGLMQQLLTQGIGHTKFKKTDIGQIPEEWEVVMMGQVIELISGQSSSSNELNYERKGIAYVTGPEQWNGYHIEETKWVENPRKIAKENSIFITVKGSGVGTIFLGGYYAIGRDVMAIVPLENINKDYLYYLALYQAQRIVYNKVGMVPGISRGDILEFKFGLPKISEQVRISKLLTSWDRKLTIEKNKRLKLIELKKGLMQSLLTGKVRVKIDEAEVTQV
ncbi:restriction endonuclease subunit S [Priestia megaterium]|uniref:restriction endonuclease subunit S n=1 Tax=Priestia megaterium TaxID=1404 RepID=UPI003000F063